MFQVYMHSKKRLHVIVYFWEITDICCSFWYFLSQITNVFSCVWGQLIHHDKEKPHCGCIAGICSGVFLILRPCLFVCWECLFWLLSFLSLSFFFSSLLFCLSACSVFGEVSANTIHIVEMGFLPMGYVTVGDLQHKAVVWATRMEGTCGRMS